MDPIANFIGYGVILLVSVAVAAAILTVAADFLLKKFTMFWRMVFILGQWERVNYIMEHLPKNYWEDHKNWKVFRLRDCRGADPSEPIDE